jgi:hypothetical protein
MKRKPAIHDPDVSGPLGRYHPRAPHLTLARPSPMGFEGAWAGVLRDFARAVRDGQALPEAPLASAPPTPGRPRLESRSSCWGRQSPPR